MATAARIVGVSAPPTPLKGLGGEGESQSALASPSPASTALMGSAGLRNPMRMPIPGLASGGRQPLPPHVPLSFPSVPPQRTREGEGSGANV